jgi:uncharacterized membrane protein YhaH (DUF805 family)
MTEMLYMTEGIQLNIWMALGVFASTALTDAVYVFFNAAVAQRRSIRAATWSSIWYLLSAFAVISYTHNATYVLFAAGGSWVGAFCAVTWLGPVVATARRSTSGLRERSGKTSG